MQHPHQIAEKQVDDVRPKAGLCPQGVVLLRQLRASFVLVLVVLWAELAGEFCFDLSGSDNSLAELPH